MLLTQIKKHFTWIVFIISILFLFLLKLPYFKLPFYWDEAWSYGVATFEMAKEGPTLLPDPHLTHLTRGHPLFYYFLASSWIKYFGASVFSAHVFSFLIAILSLFICKWVFTQLNHDKGIGLLVSLGTLTQSAFLTQCTMLLPEVFLMLLGTLTLYFYYQNKPLGYLISGSILMLTKESGLVWIAFVIFDHFITKPLFIQNPKNMLEKSNILKSLYLFIPLIPFICFIIVQKLKAGFFLFPEHVGMIKTSVESILNQLKGVFQSLFLSHGRNFWSFTFLVALLWLFIRKKTNQLIIYFPLSVFVFLLANWFFFGINFFTPRYLIPVYPWFCFFIFFTVFHAFSNSTTEENSRGNKATWVATFIGGSLILVSLVTALTLKGEEDTILTYKNSVEVHQKAIHYCEVQEWQSKKIYTNFLMQYYLKFPYLGYLKQGKGFSYFVNDLDSSDILIFYSAELDPTYAQIHSNEKFSLVKRFEQEGAWVEIYRRRK